jgi:hypothetical protein
VAEGRLGSIEATPPSRSTVLFGYVVGGTAVILGILTVGFIIYSVIN